VAQDARRARARRARRAGHRPAGVRRADRLARDAPILPQLDAVVAAAVERLAQESDGEVVVVGNSLGGCLALRAAARDDLPISGIVPVAPAGFDHPTWFRAIEGDALVRSVLAGPLPERIVHAFLGQAYRQLAFARPRAIEGRGGPRVRRPPRHPARPAARPCHGPPAAPRARRPVRSRADRRPGPARVGRTRPDGHPPRRPPRPSRALPQTQFELLADCGHCPQLEQPERFGQLLEAFASARVPAA
jgi:pimeloyl-ACP methyl ester carboxylesterase